MLDLATLFSPTTTRYRGPHRAADGAVWDCHCDGYVFVANAHEGADALGMEPVPAAVCALVLEATATHEMNADALATWCRMCAHLDPPDDAKAPAMMLGVTVNARIIEPVAGYIAAVDTVAAIGLAADHRNSAGLFVLIGDDWRAAFAGMTFPADWPLPELPARRVNPHLRAAERAAALVKAAEGDIAEADDALTAAIAAHHKARLALKAALRPLACKERERVIAGLSTHIDL